MHLIPVIIRNQYQFNIQSISITVQNSIQFNIQYSAQYSNQFSSFSFSFLYNSIFMIKYGRSASPYRYAEKGSGPTWVWLSLFLTR